MGGNGDGDDTGGTPERARMNNPDVSRADVSEAKADEQESKVEDLGQGMEVGVPLGDSQEESPLRRRRSADTSPLCEEEVDYEDYEEVLEVEEPVELALDPSQQV